MSKINRIIAEKVMRVREALWPFWWLKGDGWYFLPEGKPAHADNYVYFDPEHRIEHAHMALEKFPDYKLKKHTLSNSMILYDCRLLDDDFNIFEHKDAATPSESISQAIVKAVEGKE